MDGRDPERETQETFACDQLHSSFFGASENLTSGAEWTWSDDYLTSRSLHTEPVSRGHARLVKRAELEPAFGKELGGTAGNITLAWRTNCAHRCMGSWFSQPHIEDHGQGPGGCPRNARFIHESARRCTDWSRTFSFTPRSNCCQRSETNRKRRLTIRPFG